MSRSAYFTENKQQFQGFYHNMHIHSFGQHIAQLVQTLLTFLVFFDFLLILTNVIVRVQKLIAYTYMAFCTHISTLLALCGFELIIMAKLLFFLFTFWIRNQIKMQNLLIYCVILSAQQTNLKICPYKMWIEFENRQRGTEIDNGNRRCSVISTDLVKYWLIYSFIFFVLFVNQSSEWRF